MYFERVFRIRNKAILNTTKSRLSEKGLVDDRRRQLFIRRSAWGAFVEIVEQSFPLLDRTCSQVCIDEMAQEPANTYLQFTAHPNINASMKFSSSCEIIPAFFSWLYWRYQYVLNYKWYLLRSKDYCNSSSFLVFRAFLCYIRHRDIVR